MEKLKNKHPFLKDLMLKNRKTCPVIRRILILALLAINFSAFSVILPAKYFTADEIKKANTALATKYLTTVEKEIYLTVNLARMYPKKFLKMYFDFVEEEGNKKKLTTNNYYKTLTKELQALKAMPALQPDKQLYETAKCWAVEAGKSGKTGHDRIKCKEDYYAECCSYGCHSGLEIIMQLLIDEDVKSLGHRHICLSSSYLFVGVSKQPHSVWKTNTVMDFSHKSSQAKK
jgi:uncharacterized protein YkwD